ncbi:MAG: hypothetical protein ACI85U_001852, partial [Candidatus Promineifilaceae bacterium]
MKYPIEIPGFEGQDLRVESGGFFRAPKISVNGEAPPKGPKWGSLSLTRNDGTQAVVRMVNNFVDPIPGVTVDGEKYHPTEPLSWFQFIWGGWPVILLFVGGFVGAIFGLIPGMVNGRIFRSEMNDALKYAVTGGICFVACGLYLIM